MWAGFGAVLERFFEIRVRRSGRVGRYLRAGVSAGTTADRRRDGRREVWIVRLRKSVCLRGSTVCWTRAWGLLQLDRRIIRLAWWSSLAVAALVGAAVGWCRLAFDVVVRRGTVGVRSVRVCVGV